MKPNTKAGATSSVSQSERRSIGIPDAAKLQKLKEQLESLKSLSTDKLRSLSQAGDAAAQHEYAMRVMSEVEAANWQSAIPDCMTWLQRSADQGYAPG